MNVPLFLTTSRLVIEPLTLNDNDFIFKLVNTEGWLKFIGDRNIKSTDEAADYIRKILASKNIFYWVIIASYNFILYHFTKYIFIICEHL